MTSVSNRTKVVATVGPASHDKHMLEQLILAGVNVFRLNFSHGSHEGHAAVIKAIRELNESLGTFVGILQDLQGPKIRTDDVEDNGVELFPGDRIVIGTHKVLGNRQRISTTYQRLAQDVREGDTVLIDDGNLELRVLGTNGDEVEAEIIHGGMLRSRKGINLPNTNVSAPSLTEKDHEDLLFGLAHHVDWVALSFVRSAEDIRYIKSIIAEHNSYTRVVAKIEKPQAIENIDEIVAATDGLMVARGDLGVEIPMEDVPLLQKQIVAKCNTAAKPVIIATQMLESMIVNPRPTRAETTDVANAVIDGADAVMLSAETAAGRYPVLAVRAMSRVIHAVEQQADIYNKRFSDLDPHSPTLPHDSVVASACTLAQAVGAKAIATITRSGYSAMQVSSHRPAAQIFIFSRYPQLITQLSLVWGVRPIPYEISRSTDEMMEDLATLLKQKGHLVPGDTLIHTASIPIAKKGRANMIKFTIIE